VTSRSLTSCAQYVEFAGADEDDQDESSVDGYDVQLPNPNAEKANSQQAKSLEALLALKNKRILDELAKFRVRSSSHDGS
jgi:homeobox protein cut-like